MTGASTLTEAACTRDTSASRILSCLYSWFGTRKLFIAALSTSPFQNKPGMRFPPPQEAASSCRTSRYALPASRERDQAAAILTEPICFWSYVFVLTNRREHAYLRALTGATTLSILRIRQELTCGDTSIQNGSAVHGFAVCDGLGKSYNVQFPQNLLQKCRVPKVHLMIQPSNPLRQSSKDCGEMHDICGAGTL